MEPNEAFPTTRVIQLPQRQLYEPLPNGYLKYVNHLGDDLTPLEAARMSTGNPTGVDEAHDSGTRKFLWRNEHSTPFEMTVLQVEIQCPIFVAREWMRHRTQSYNEYSGRYSEMMDLFYVPEPDRILEASGGEPWQMLRGNIIMEQRSAREDYEARLADGMSKELARINLPVSQMTKFRAQANLRNWLHFLNLRMSSKAQYEIRVYANAVADLIQQIWPKTYEVFEEYTLYSLKLSRTEKNALAELLRNEDRRAVFDSLLVIEGVKLKRIQELFAEMGL